MATQVQWRGGSTAEHATFTGAAREITVDTQKQTLVLHDGSTAGGRPLLREDGSNAALSLGSAGTPSLKFTGDTNTGIYSPGADQVAVATNGAGRLFVDANGNVGVGTASPSDTSGFGGTLDINGTTGAACYVRTNGSATDYGFIGHYGADFYVNNNSNGPTRFFTNESERLRITSAGLVGIGTSAPTNTAGFAQQVEIAGSVPCLTLNQNNAGFTTRKYSLAVNATGDFGIWDNTPSVYRLYINTSGNVGIGTSTPSGKLHVIGDSATPGIGNINISNSAFPTSGWAFRIPDSGATIDLSLDGAVGGIFRSVMYFARGTGNVGIGTTNPLKELQINATTPTIRLEENGGGSKRFELSIDSSAEAKVFAEQSGSQLLFGTVGTERARIDSSGRLLVGTSSTSTNLRALIQATSANSAGGGNLYLARGESTPADGASLGYLGFSDSNHTSAAGLEAVRDGGTWTSGSSQPSRLVFSTTADGASSPTERMRITSGIDLVGISSPDGSHSVIVYNGTSAGTGLALFIGKYGSSAPYTGGTNSIIIWTNGNVVNTNNSYGALSDIKLKENVVDANSQWDDLKALQVRNYNFKEGQTHTQIGLVAQEVELVSPGLVSESPDRDEDGNDLGTVTKSVNYSVLYMKAVKALQEAMERIEQLEAKVAALETK